MKDPYQEMMAEIMGYMLFLACFFIALVVSGCAPVVAPNLKLPETKACPIPKLPPIPDDVILDISGDKITANAGGQTVLRGYVACRSAGALAR